MNAPTPTIREVHPRERAQGIALKLSPFVEFSMRTVDVIEAGIREDRRARTFLESIPADGGTVKALDPAIVSALAAYLAQYRDKALKGIELERWAHGVVRALGGVVDERHTAAGAGPVGEAVADEGWQPIETAPTGGKFGCFLMLAFGPPGDQTVSEGMHFQGRFYAASVFYTGGPQDTKQFTFREHEVKPTHWRHTLATPGAARPVDEPGEVERQRGWIYFNPDAGTEWAESHPVESGEVHDAEDIRLGTAEELLKQLLPAWRELATETSRRETAEASLAETRERLEKVEAERRHWQAKVDALNAECEATLLRAETAEIALAAREVAR